MQEEGKHYVISDLHGRKDLYDMVIRKLNPSDTLFILGDVLGKKQEERKKEQNDESSMIENNNEDEGIDILIDIMKRHYNPGNGPRVVFIMGNHEMQFLECLKLINNKELKPEERRLVLEVGKILYDLDKKKSNGLKITTEEEGLKQSALLKLKALNGTKLPGIKTVDEKQCILLYIGITQCGGEKAINYFLNRNTMSQKERAEMNDFLKNQILIAYSQQIMGKDYLLLHSLPPQPDEDVFSMKLIESIRGKNNGLPYYMIPVRTRRDMLEERSNDGKKYIPARNAGFTTTICGHTPSENGKVMVGENDLFVRIDTGCSIGEKSPLALLCLEELAKLNNIQNGLSRGNAVEYIGGSSSKGENPGEIITGEQLPLRMIDDDGSR